MQNLTIGKRIHLLRETLKKQDKKKYSLQSVADRLGVVTKQSLSLIERGKIKNPGSVVLNKLAADFGITVDFLLTGIGGHKENFLEKKKLLTATLHGCRKAVNTCRTKCPPASLYLHEKVSNLLELFIVVVDCLEREVSENYDHYTSQIGKLISFLEFIASVIPVLGQNQSLEKFIDRAFWDLGRVIREIAVQIDRDGNQRNFYPEELQNIAKTAVSIMSSIEKQEPPALPQTLEVVVKDFHLRLTYHGPVDIPDEYLTEFKKRVIYEWKMMFARIRVKENDGRMEKALDPKLIMNQSTALE